MHLWTDLAEVPTDLDGSVVTIGNFDGVHAGHHRVLACVVDFARSRELISVAVTFHPHPVAVLYPERAPEEVTSPRIRRELLAGTGLGALLDVEFTKELAKQSPRQYVKETFVDALHARAVVVGGDVRFGYRNAGDITTLRDLGDEFGFEVRTLQDVHGTVHGRHPHRRWSSSWVRELLRIGDVRAAAQILGRAHLMRGAVVHGDHRGRQLGFPTANLGPGAEGMIPADGVYSGWVVRPGAAEPRLPAAISVGTNPTFRGERTRRVEAYVLDRTDLDLYGAEIVVEFVELLRPTVRFESLDDLVTQMYEDVECAYQTLGLTRPTASQPTAPRPQH